MKQKLFNDPNSIKIFTLIVLLLSINICVARNNTISGMVKDEDGNPVAGASVTLKASGRTATTDRNGEFSSCCGSPSRAMWARQGTPGILSSTLQNAPARNLPTCSLYKILHYYLHNPPNALPAFIFH